MHYGLAYGIHYLNNIQYENQNQNINYEPGHQLYIPLFLLDFFLKLQFSEKCYIKMLLLFLKC